MDRFLRLFKTLRKAKVHFCVLAFRFNILDLFSLSRSPVCLTYRSPRFCSANEGGEIKTVEDLSANDLEVPEEQTQVFKV